MSRSASRSNDDRLPRGAPSHQSAPIASGSSPHISCRPIAASSPATHGDETDARIAAPSHDARGCHILCTRRPVALRPFTRACVRACVLREMPTERALGPMGPCRVGVEIAGCKEREGDGKGGNERPVKGPSCAARTRPISASLDSSRGFATTGHRLLHAIRPLPSAR